MMGPSGPEPQTLGPKLWTTKKRQKQATGERPTKTSKSDDSQEFGHE